MRRFNSCASLRKTRSRASNVFPDKTGEVVWDADWNKYTLTDVFKLCVIDTGVGMDGEEMIQYINALSSSANVLSSTGNYGVGAKIAAGTA